MTNKADGVTIDDISISCQEGAVIINGRNNITLSNSDCYGLGSSVDVLHSSNITLHNVSLVTSVDNTESFQTGLRIDNSSYVQVFSSKFLNGYDLEGITNSVVSYQGMATIISNSKNIFFTDCEISNNTKINSGAISITSGSSVSFINTIFSHNRPASMDTSGGAIRAEDSILTLQNCTFYNNSANIGGALNLRNTTINVANSRFLSNMANYKGFKYISIYYTKFFYSF